MNRTPYQDYLRVKSRKKWTKILGNALLLVSFAWLSAFFLLLAFGVIQ